MLRDMADDSAVSAFRDAFITRTKQSREARGLTQREMAIALGIEKEAYSKYESRSCLPHHLVRRFCMVCNVTTPPPEGGGFSLHWQPHEHEACASRHD